MTGAARLSPEQLAAVGDLWTRSGRELAVRLTGSSMGPAIPSGSQVRIACGRQPALGDVVAYRDAAGVIVHRVVARGPAWILTRGDARVLPDAPVRDTGAVLGCVSGVGAEPFSAAAALRASVAQRAVLLPLLLALRVHAPTGLALLDGVVHARRLALRALAPLRQRLSARRR